MGPADNIKRHGASFQEQKTRGARKDAPLHIAAVGATKSCSSTIGVGVQPELLFDLDLARVEHLCLPARGRQKHLFELCEFFLQVLAVEMEAAAQTGRTDDQRKLEAISDTVVQIIQESQPPEIQFINELVVADYPEGTLALLEQERDAITAELLEMMSIVREDLRASGRVEIEQKLSRIQGQAEEMIEGVQ